MWRVFEAKDSSLSTTRICDPIHGTLEVDKAEVAIIDSPFYQRLRHVKQLGFSDQAFPGATHSRYSHGLGAMHVATRVFDVIFRGGLASEMAHLRRLLRIAVLLHDVGHPPLSHASEAILPMRSALDLPEDVTGPIAAQRRASHEDFTAKILLDSDLSDTLRAHDYDPEAVTYLLSGRPRKMRAVAQVGGLDYGPILRQIVSSEIDADRMDYLLRDSFYTGVNYGKFDANWLIQNLTSFAHEGAVHLALSSRAIFAFEDFLLSRYHMFLSVYYHYRPVIYDRMLLAYYDETQGEYRIPADAASYLAYDDVQLLSVLRASRSEWARRIVRREPYRLLLEVHSFDRGLAREGLRADLTGLGIPFFETESRGVISKYFASEPTESTPPIFVVVSSLKQARRLEEYTPLYRKYSETVDVYRIYCHPDRHQDAERALEGHRLSAT